MRTTAESPRETPSTSTIRRDLVAAEQFHSLGKPGEALRRAEEALERARALRTDEARSLAELLRSRMRRYREAIEAKARSSRERGESFRQRDLADFPTSATEQKGTRAHD